MARLVFWLAFTALAAAQTSSGFAGLWSLNRSLSEFPKELGFNADWFPLPDAANRPPVIPRRETYEDSQRVRVVTDEVRNPPARLTIVDNTASVVITNDTSAPRTLHPAAKPESIDIQGVPVMATTARDGARLIVTYHVEQDREIRFTYSSSGNPARLAVETQFLDHGKGDKVTRIYEAGAVAVAAQAPSAPPPAGGPARETFDQRPGAEFKGLKDVGVLVEDLGPEAAACGLRRDALEDALAKRLTAGGLNVRKNSDEDTYVYANVITTSMPNGTCVSRYDAFLYTHATARLAYREQPVLVQVSLMHRGNIGTSSVAAHPSAVSRALEGYVDLFVTQIRDANR